MLGDCLMIFAHDYMNLLKFIDRIKEEFEKLKSQGKITKEDFRFIIGFGYLIKETIGDNKDFAGEEIIKTVRIDHPMKEWIKDNKESQNQIWCTEDTKEQIVKNL